MVYVYVASRTRVVHTMVGRGLQRRQRAPANILIPSNPIYHIIQYQRCIRLGVSKLVLS